MPWRAFYRRPYVTRGSASALRWAAIRARNKRAARKFAAKWVRPRYVPHLLGLANYNLRSQRYRRLRSGRRYRNY